MPTEAIVGYLLRRSPMVPDWLHVALHITGLQLSLEENRNEIEYLLNNIS